MTDRRSYSICQPAILSYKALNKESIIAPVSMSIFIWDYLTLTRPHYYSMFLCICGGVFFKVYYTGDDAYLYPCLFIIPNKSRIYISSTRCEKRYVLISITIRPSRISTILSVCSAILRSWVTMTKAVPYFSLISRKIR